LLIWLTLYSGYSAEHLAVYIARTTQLPSYPNILISSLPEHLLVASFQSYLNSSLPAYLNTQLLSFPEQLAASVSFPDRLAINFSLPE
jgi:hypothetical protein